MRTSTSSMERMKRAANFLPWVVRQDVPNGVWHRVEVFGGLPTELYGTEVETKPAGSTDLQVVVLPGNPGACSFYAHFLKYLHLYLRGNPRVTGISFVGHESGIHLHGKRVFSLEDQIQHKVAVLGGLCRNFMGRTVVIGHSIGAYIGLKAAERLRGSRLGSGREIEVVALFPFLARNPRCLRQKRLDAFTILDLMTGMGTCVGRVLSWLPRKWVGNLVGWWDSDLDPHAVWAAVGLVDRYHLRNAIHLGHCEFRELKELDYDFLRSFAGCTTLLCTPGDIWFPDWQRQCIEREVPKLKIHQVYGFMHGFPVSVTMSESLAKAIANTLNPSL